MPPGIVPTERIPPPVTTGEILALPPLDREGYGWTLTQGWSMRESRPVVCSVGPTLRVAQSRFIAGPAKAALEVNVPTPGRTVCDQEVARRF